MRRLVPILEFAWKLGFRDLYDWQCKILLRYEAGEPVAAACANYTGKTSVIFPICALWTLYNFPIARLMYMSATWLQVTNQFFASLDRFRDQPMFAGWEWLESEVRTGQGGFLFGRSSDVSGHIEGIHDQYNSPAGLLIDEAKSIPDNKAIARLETTQDALELRPVPTSARSVFEPDFVTVFFEFRNLAITILFFSRYPRITYVHDVLIST